MLCAVVQKLEIVDQSCSRFRLVLALGVNCLAGEINRITACYRLLLTDFTSIDFLLEEIVIII